MYQNWNKNFFCTTADYAPKMYKIGKKEFVGIRLESIGETAYYVTPYGIMSVKHHDIMLCASKVSKDQRRDCLEMLYRYQHKDVVDRYDEYHLTRYG